MSKVIKQWRNDIAKHDEFQKPVMEPLYIDLVDSPDKSPEPIHLGLRLGVNHLVEYLKLRQEIGVNHIAINLRFNTKKTEKTMNKLAEFVLPEFHN